MLSAFIKPDRDFDCQLARDVLGWTKVRPGNIHMDFIGHDPDRGGEFWVPRYTEDMNAAMRLVEVLISDDKEDGPPLDFALTFHVYWTAKFFNGEMTPGNMRYSGTDKTPALAICKAVARTMGISFYGEDNVKPLRPEEV